MPNLQRPKPRLLSLITATLLYGAAVGCAGSTPEAKTPQSAPAKPPPREPLPADIVESSALPIEARTKAGPLSLEEYDDLLWESRAVCLGETHSSPHHHYAQLQALRSAQVRAQREASVLGVGFEMFQQPFQEQLRSFVSGESDEETFLAETEYAKRWGFDFALYRPLLEVVRDGALEAVALNAPRELSKQIGRHGLESLSPEQRERLPELDLNDEVHRTYFDEAMGAHPMPEGGPSIQNMYAAQVLWDEAMAQASASWLSSKGEASHLFIVAGSGHCHRTAIPGRVERRSGPRVLSVLPVLASKLEPDHELFERYDVLVVLDDRQPE